MNREQEYFWYNIDRSANTGLPPLGAPSLKFRAGTRLALIPI
ncbi:hypothetical protein [Bradyrhizobium canariense]|nr:hypothetical protein [Bradyrhizobium canariense]